MGDHDLFDRLFLRECAHFIRFNPKRDDHWIWTRATYALSVNAILIEIFLVLALSAVLKDVIPSGLNPLNNTGWPLAIAFIAVGVFTGLSVDKAAARFRHDVSAAAAYSRPIDRFFWIARVCILLITLLGTFLIGTYLIRHPL